MLKSSLIVVLVVFVIVAVLFYFIASGSAYRLESYDRESFSAKFEPSKKYERQKWADDGSLKYPAKCVSCERMFPLGEKWRGQPTKCFSCEAHAQRNPQYGMSPQDTHPLPAHIHM